MGETMRIPEKNYTLEDFINYLLDHSKQVFGDEERKRWLKIYCFLVSGDGWKRSLFKRNELKKLGEIYKATPRYEASKNAEEEELYYIGTYAPGLLLFFTTAVKEGYRKTLGDKIGRTRGITNMWAKPNLYKRSWKEVLDTTEGYVYWFSSRRNPSDDTPCQLRPNYQRRFNYTGDDGAQVIEEIISLYGVTPDSVKIKVSEDLKVHITNEGLFSAKEASPFALNLFIKYINGIKDEILQAREVASSLKFERIEGEGDMEGFNFASIEAGIIELKEEAMDAYMAETIEKELKGFSFIDRYLHEGSLRYTATVIDDVKNSVFDISADESSIILVPKYRTTFESFLEFYRGITEFVDEQASFRLLEGA